MDDEVLSLGGQSESEEEEGDLVHLAYNFAKGAVGQGVDIDFAKAIHDASEEIATCKDFVDISELSEAEDVEDLRMNEAAASGREGAAGGEELELEDAAAQDTFYHILGMELCLWMCSLVCSSMYVVPLFLGIVLELLPHRISTQLFRLMVLYDLYII